MVKATEVKKVIGKHMLADGFDVIIDLEKSHGCRLVDKRDNSEYLDFFSMFASLAIGFNHPYLVSKQAELGKIAINKPTNSDIYSEEMASFLETFSRVVMPDYLKYAFFVSGGGLAVENAMKAAFDWKVRKNFAAGEKNIVGLQIMHFKQAFHGRTGYTLSLTNTSDPRKTQYFPQFDWPRITNPKAIFPLEDNLEKVIASEKQALAEIDAAIKANGKDIAAIMIEPIQGEGGDNHFRKEFFTALREVCDKNDMLLIFDEVQSGVGITGKTWAHQNYDVIPDIISFGKKTQVCGIMAGPKMDEVEKHVFKESSRINSTWGGNLIDMVRFKYILEVIEKENLIENAAKQGDLLLSELEAIQADFPELISNARGKGLMCAFDLPNGDLRDKFLVEMWENKVMILGCGDQAIRFRPHLIVTADEIKEGCAVIRKVLKKM